jgi:hypothetical protein
MSTPQEQEDSTDRPNEFYDGEDGVDAEDTGGPVPEPSDPGEAEAREGADPA